MDFELADQVQFAQGVEGVLETQGAAELGHRQVPLQRASVPREGHPILLGFSEGHGLHQPIDELGEGSKSDKEPIRNQQITGKRSSDLSRAWEGNRGGNQTLLPKNPC